MCCFGVRVFLLFFITILSFVFHKLYPQIAVVFYYFILANILGFLMLSLYFNKMLPSFVKEGSMHYFSLIGGFAGSFISVFVFRYFNSKFITIQALLSVFWIVLISVVLLNLKDISNFFLEFLS